MQEKLQGRQTAQPEDPSRKVVSSNPSAGNIFFLIKSLLNIYLEIHFFCKVVIIIHVAEVNCQILLHVHMWLIYTGPEK